MIYFVKFGQFVVWKFVFNEKFVFKQDNSRRKEEWKMSEGICGFYSVVAVMLILVKRLCNLLGWNTMEYGGLIE